MSNNPHLFADLNDEENDALKDTDEENDNDNDILESEYILLPEPVSLMSATPITIKDSTESIIVLRNKKKIFKFLRKKI